MRMVNTDANEAARLLARQRWGNRGALKAAAVVVERADELPDAVRAEVREAMDQEAEAGQ